MHILHANAYMRTKIYDAKQNKKEKAQSREEQKHIQNGTVIPFIKSCFNR